MSITKLLYSVSKEMPKTEKKLHDFLLLLRVFVGYIEFLA